MWFADALTDNMGMWERVADRFGIPVVLLAVAIAAAAIIVRWLANNVVKPLVNSHTTLVEVLKTTTVKNTETTALIARRQDEAIEIVKASGVQIAEAIGNQTEKLLASLGPSRTDSSTNSNFGPSLRPKSEPVSDNKAVSLGS